MTITDAVAPSGDMGISSESEGLVDTSTPEVTGTEVSTEVPTESAEAIEAPEGALFEVDGEWITLDEARNGYQRQADYTRKTQEVAAERKRVEQMAALASALEQNPAATLAALAESYGVGMGQPDLAELEAMDPVERQVAELQTQLQDIQRERQLAAVDREIADFSTRHQGVDVEQVMAFAVSRQLPDLETAYRVLAFDDMSAAQQAQQSEQTRIEAKRAAQVVSSDSSRQGTTPLKSKKYANFREAAMAALEEHNVV